MLKGTFCYRFSLRNVPYSFVRQHRRSSRERTGGIVAVEHAGRRCSQIANVIDGFVKRFIILLFAVFPLKRNGRETFRKV